MTTIRSSPCVTALMVAALVAVLPGEGGAQEQEPGAGLRVWLVTAAPGDAVWERFGHNAIRVLDVNTGRDVSYNWGIFSFDQPGFIARFLKGEMLYMMAPFWTGPMVDSYTDVARDVVLQELALTPRQSAELHAFLEWNALPENREYRYDYFRDNCSTRVRDALDRAMGGTLAARFGSTPTGTSFRWHVRRLTRMDPLIYTGMDVLLGSRGDRPITVWEEMFLPMTLRDAVRHLTVTDEAGVERPFVVDEVRVGPATRPDDAPAPPGWLPWYLLLGVALGALMAWSGARSSGARGARGPTWARVTFAVTAGGWSLLAGVVGLLLVVVLFTDHVYMAWNANLFLLTPLCLPLAVLAPRAAWRRSPGAERVAGAVLIVALAGAAYSLAALVLPVPAQDNLVFLALALPAHAGLWWGVRANSRAAVPPEGR